MIIKKPIKITTDIGTAFIIDHLTPSGKAQVKHLIEQILSYRITSGNIQGNVFAKNLGVKKITFSVENKGKSDFLLATVDFGQGVLWRRGSLRLVNVTIPESAKTAFKGKKIAQIVEGTPFPDFTVKNIVEDKSVKGSKLRIMCKESEKVEISL